MPAGYAQQPSMLTPAAPEGLAGAGHRAGLVGEPDGEIRCHAALFTLPAQMPSWTAATLGLRGGRLRGTQPRAAPRGRGRARPGLHPRGRGLGQDDDDHAPRREPGRHGRLRARRDPGGHLHGQGGDGDARARLAASARPASPRAPSTRPRSPSSATSAARSSARCSRRRRPCCSRSRGRSPARSASGRSPTSPPRSSGRRTGALTPATYRDSARRPRAADPRRPDGARVPELRGAQGRPRARSTSRTCSSWRSACTTRTRPRWPAFRERYRAFTVDEYQDVNLLQQSLLDRWLGERDDLCVVGDDYQSIYSFTGATPEHLLGMPARFPGALVVRLEENYRSTPEILAVANRLVPELGGSEKVLRAVLPAGEEPLALVQPDRAVRGRVPGRPGAPPGRRGRAVRGDGRPLPPERALGGLRGGLRARRDPVPGARRGVHPPARPRSGRCGSCAAARTARRSARWPRPSASRAGSPTRPPASARRS